MTYVGNAKGGVMSICSWFKKKKEVGLEPPVSTNEIGMVDLRSILQWMAPNADLFLSDRTYRLCHTENIERFLVQDATDREDYQAERYDFDDFAYRLMGQFSVPDWSDLTIGIVWTNVHALNCVVDEDRQFWFVEPQTDELVKVLEGVDTIRMIMM